MNSCTYDECHETTKTIKFHGANKFRQSWMNVTKPQKPQKSMEQINSDIKQQKPWKSTEQINSDIYNKCYKTTKTIKIHSVNIFRQLYMLILIATLK